MKIVRTLLAGIGVVLVALAIVTVIAWLRTGPGAFPRESESAARLRPGPNQVSSVDLEWVDRSRSTAANGDAPGAPQRVLPVTLWYPEEAAGEHPLLVFCHGFVSSRRGGRYLAEELASRGFVVVAPDFPLTRLGAPGGPRVEDVVHQPGDVSFVIDRVLALAATERPFAGTIDRRRIGVFGISLGGATATLTAFHPEWRDPRVQAAISIAGPGDVFGPRFFEGADVPFLMIAGTSDAIVDYESNAAPIPERIRTGGLVTLVGGTHIGFTDVSSGVMRLFGNPDRVGCRLAGADPESASEHPFSGLFGTLEQGLLEVTEYPTPCVRRYEETLTAARQHRLTQLAVSAFFESTLGRDPAERQASWRYLSETLPAELPEVRVTPAARKAASEPIGESP